MRFSQPVNKNMQKGIREVQKCKKAGEKGGVRKCHKATRYMI
jgi:hypothetical protein